MSGMKMTVLNRAYYTATSMITVMAQDLYLQKQITLSVNV